LIWLDFRDDQPAGSAGVAKREAENGHWAGSVNKVILVGNLGRDPEIRSTQDGTRVANLSLATSESWRDKNSGERREKTEWHRVVVFNERIVDVAEKYLHKGSKVYVEGQLQTRKWTDQSGQEKYTTEIVLQRFPRRTHHARRPRATGGEAGGYASRPMKARRKAAPPAAAVAAAAGRQVRAPTSTTTSRSSPSSQGNQSEHIHARGAFDEQGSSCRPAQGKLSRRDFNRALAAVGLSFAVMPLTARSSRAASNLTFFTWAGYDVPEAAAAVRRQAWWPAELCGFRERGRGAAEDARGNSSRICASLQLQHQALEDAGVLQPIDVSRPA